MPASRNPRYFVPDLSPADRPAERPWTPSWIFVAESPHTSEITPERREDRRPLCGAAGKRWWALLSEILEGEKDPAKAQEVSLERLLRFCREHSIAVLNAVQWPLDPKVMKSFPEADPVGMLGFSKAPGDDHFKRKKDLPPVGNALTALRSRLEEGAIREVPIICLGNDADWFVTRALGKERSAQRVRCKIPHPSAWWRRGGAFEKVAREKLLETLARRPG